MDHTNSYLWFILNSIIVLTKRYKSLYEKVLDTWGPLAVTLMAKAVNTDYKLEKIESLPTSE